MYSKFFKRAIDIIASLSVLLLLSWLFIIVATVIKLQDGGCVFFIQQRIGRNVMKFNILKFRSMPVNTANVSSEQTHLIKITPFGKFIRRTNIDELPQLINILKGEMSLIGPRPSLPAQAELIELRMANGSFRCRPGLTGLAQVNSYDYMPVLEKAALDGIYAANITFIKDVGIVLKTLKYLTKKPPVY
ncbi:MAG: sugar transferase [Dysgonamonadaceae bacterium]|jgi:O-antigen biosynthesis protein WbqP|nr:sugar transferase [Dysgonamonadaceae bacterium]